MKRERARQKQHASAQTRRRLIIPPLPVELTDPSRIRICPGADPEPPPPGADLPQANSGTGTGTGPGSRANALKGALRSKLLFPLEMKTSIDDLVEQFCRELDPSTALQRWLVVEMARSTVQCDTIHDQLLVDGMRAIENAGSMWSDDRATQSERLGAKLCKQPHLAGAMGRTKHGALFMIDKYTLLGEIIETNGFLNTDQMSTLCDLLGIEHVYRNGCRQVPAGTDKEALRALVSREISKHRANLENGLNDRDRGEQGMAMLGIVKERSPETRKLRSDRSRACRRLSWAWGALVLLKGGADAASIIDPDTREPVAVGPDLSAVPEPASPAPPAPPPPPVSEPVSEPATPPSPTIPPLPEGCSEEMKDMWLVAAGAILNKRATFPADEPVPAPSA